MKRIEKTSSGCRSSKGTARRTEMIGMTETLTKKGSLVVRSPDFVYTSDGRQRQYDLVVTEPQRGLAARMLHFYQIEKHETDDGVAYIGRIDYFGQRGAVLLDEHGRPVSQIFDDIGGDIHLGAKLITETHEISYDILPDGTVTGVNYRHAHRKPLVECDRFRFFPEPEGVGLSPLGQFFQQRAEEQEKCREKVERTRKFPLADFFEYKRGVNDEKRK